MAEKQLTDLTTVLLQTATINQDYWLIKHCLNFGANADSKTAFGNPILILAKSKGIAHTLVAAGARVATYGARLLHNVINRDYSLELVQYYLTELKIDPNAKDDWGSTPLHGLTYIAKGNTDAAVHTQKAVHLIAAGADIFARNKDGKTPRQRLQEVYQAWSSFPEFVPDIEALDYVFKKAEKYAALSNGGTQ